MKTCNHCGKRHAHVEHMEYGLYQCKNTQCCLHRVFNIERKVVYIARKRDVERALFALDAFSEMFGTPKRKADVSITCEITYVN